MSDIKKIVIIGGESTGKSTLCEQLANHYNTVWVPEYARAYLVQLGRPYVKEDLVEIAIGQLSMESVLEEEANDFLFCDTDLHVLKVWSDYKYGDCDPFIDEHIGTQKHDGYIITSPDFPWIEDNLREHPEPALREYFFKRYTELVLRKGLPYCIVNGNEDMRLHTSIGFVDSL